MTNQDILLAHFTETQTKQYENDMAVLASNLDEIPNGTTFILHKIGTIHLDSHSIKDCIKIFSDLIENRKPQQSDFELDIEDNCDLGSIVIRYRENYMADKSLIYEKSRKLAEKFEMFISDDYKYPNNSNAVLARGFIAKYKEKHKL